MPNTRHHDPSTPTDPNTHQSRFFSSPEYERGLMANAVARRCTVLPKQEDRELLMFIQARSLEIGMPEVCKEISEMFPQFIATTSMQEFGTKAGKIYNADQVRKIRKEFPNGDRFVVKGDRPKCGIQLIPETDPVFKFLDSQEREHMRERLADEADRQKKLRTGYPVETLTEICREAAEANLERDLSDLCQDAAWNLNESRPWYFPNLVQALRHYQTARLEKLKKEIVETEVVAKISESLDYCLATGSIVLVEGVSGIAKQFSLESLCALQPGRVRCVQTSPMPDEGSFFREIGRSLGVSIATSLSVAQIKLRIESTLRDSGIGLAFHDAQFLFIASTHREIAYKRINWLVALANSGVAIFLCSTPQFLETVKSAETVSLWNAAQLTKKIYYVPLPSVVPKQDLTAVARHLAPDASANLIKVVVAYASTSGKFIAGIVTLIKRAEFIAQREGRERIADEDLTAAYKSVVPSAKALSDALAAIDKHPKARRLTPPPFVAPPRPVALESEPAIPTRETQPLVIQ